MLQCKADLKLSYQKNKSMNNVKLIFKLQVPGSRYRRLECKGKLLLIWACLALLPMGLLFAQPSGNPVVRLNSEMHTNLITSIDRDAGGELVLTTSRDRTAKLWDSKSSKLLKTFRVPIETTSGDGILYAGALSPDGRWAVVGGATGVLTSKSKQAIFYIFDAQNGELLKYEVTPFRSAIGNMEFSQDGRYLAVSPGGDNPSVAIYTVEYTMDGIKFNKIKTLEGYNGRITDFEFSSEGRFATVSNDGYIRLYDSNFEMMQKFKGNGDIPMNPTFSPDGKQIAVSYWDKSVIEVFDTGSFKVLYRPNLDEVREKGISKLAFSDDGSYLFGVGYHVKRINKKMWFAIRRWEKGGRGKYIDIPLDRTSQIHDLLSVGDEGIILATNSPGLVRMHTDGNVQYSKKRSKLYFNSKALDLRTNFSGDGISFKQSEGDYIFSIPMGQLRKGNSTFPQSTDQRKGIHISDWEGKSTARINGRAVKIMGGGRGVDIASDGKGVVVAAYYGLHWFNSSGEKIWEFSTDSPPNHVKVSGNGKFVVTAHSDGTVRWYSSNPKYEYEIIGLLDGSFADKSGLQTGDIILELDGKNFSTTNEMADYIKPRKKFRFKLNRNGRIKTIDVYKNGEQLGILFQPKDRLKATLYINPEDHRWILYTPSGHFDASSGGEDLAGWHINRGRNEEAKFYPLSQYYDEFYTPNLGERILRGEEFKRDVTDISLPPVVEFVSPGHGLNTDRQLVTIQTKVTDQGGGVDEVRLYQNGKLITGTQRGLKRADAFESYSFDVSLTQGENRFKAVALNNDRVESVPEYLVVNYEGAKSNTRLFTLVIGINEYKNPKYSLNYARSDASGFEERIIKGGESIFDEVVQTTITDSEATKENILAALDQIKSAAGPEDMFVFYYAGHGVMSDPATGTSEFYMAPSDVTQLYGNEALLKSHGIAASEIQEYSKNIRAQKQLFVLDACQSGGATEMLAMRGAAEEKAIAQLARSTGTFWLTASGSEQFATEFATLGHGVFTYAILEGLNGSADQGVKDGKITVQELSAFLNDRVPELTQIHKGQSQYPSSYGFGQDFPLSIVNE